MEFGWREIKLRNRCKGRGYSPAQFITEEGRFYHRGREVIITEEGANSIRFLSQRKGGFYHRGRGEFHSLFITEGARFFSQR
jgi:hypothetical protein